MTNKNLRVLKTKRKLLDALIELKQAEHKKITISKLIQHAHITRGPFICIIMIVMISCTQLIFRLLILCLRLA